MRTAPSTDDTSAGAAPEKRQSTFFTRSPELVGSIGPAKLSQCWQAAGLIESTHRTNYQSSIGQNTTILWVISPEIGTVQSGVFTSTASTPAARSNAMFARCEVGGDSGRGASVEMGRFRRGGHRLAGAPNVQHHLTDIHHGHSMAVGTGVEPVDANGSARPSAPSSQARRTDRQHAPNRVCVECNVPLVCMSIACGGFGRVRPESTGAVGQERTYVERSFGPLMFAY